MNDGIEVPEGKLASKVTYLQMFERPARKLRLDPPVDARVERAAELSIPFYRFLYNTVGRDWLWVDRRLLTDEALAESVLAPGIEVHVLYAGGVPAGYAEFDLRDLADVELVYFGLMPDRIGSGLGKFLIDWSIEYAFSRGAKRYWLHTCDRDHPRALEFYQRAGFVPYKEEFEVKDDPRLLGVL